MNQLHALELVEAGYLVRSVVVVVIEADHRVESHFENQMIVVGHYQMIVVVKFADERADVLLQYQHVTVKIVTPPHVKLKVLE